MFFPANLSARCRKLKSFKRVIFSAPRQGISAETEDSEMTHSASTGTQNRNSIDQARHCARANTAPSITWSAGKLRPTWSFIVVPRSQDGRTTVIRRSYDSFTSFTTVVRWWQDGRTTILRQFYSSLATVVPRSQDGRTTVIRRDAGRKRRRTHVHSLSAACHARSGRKTENARREKSESVNYIEFH